MQDKLIIEMPIIVEGVYDKNRILSVAQADVYTTDGFSVFNSEEKKALFRRLAEKKGIIVITDSDGAGKVIRGYLKSFIPADRIFDVFIEKIPGKEKRKAKRSAEGILGVEGMSAEYMYEKLKRFGGAGTVERSRITKTDFYDSGLSGGSCSSARRDAVAKICGLPSGMTSNSLLSALNILISREEFLDMVKRVGSDG